MPKYVKGQSGNPGGRSFDTIISDCLRRRMRHEVEVYEDTLEPAPLKKKIRRKGISIIKMKVADVIAAQAARDAMFGSLEAIRFCTDRMEGRPVQPVDQSNTFDGPADMLLKIVQAVAQKRIPEDLNLVDVTPPSRPAPLAQLPSVGKTVEAE